MYAADNPALRLSNTDFVRGLFRSFEEDKKTKDDGFHTLGLMTLLPLKFVYTAFCVVSPLPAGIFSPVFAIGGILGRLIGNAIQSGAGTYFLRSSTVLVRSL